MRDRLAIGSGTRAQMPRMRPISGQLATNTPSSSITAVKRTTMQRTTEKIKAEPAGVGVQREQMEGSAGITFPVVLPEDR